MEKLAVGALLAQDITEMKACFVCVFLGIVGVLCGAETVGRPWAITVGVVQMRCSRDFSENLVHIKSLLHNCATQGVRVAVFPECALTGYFEEVVTNLPASEIARGEEAVARACREESIYAIVGAPFREGKKLYNSAVVFTPEGKILERYHKVQLAEGWPEGGDHLSVFPLDGVPCSIIICHDERYPELVRLPVLAGARLIFYLSHESGLREEHKINPYRAQIQARAVENTVFIAQANAPANPDLSGSHGQSRLIGPDGNILQEASIFKEDVLVAKLDLRKATAENAKNSVARGPLKDWWQEGIKRVKMVKP